MAKTKPFDNYSDEYDSWFKDHETIYESELRAAGELVFDEFNLLIFLLGFHKFWKKLIFNIVTRKSTKYRPETSHLCN